MGTSATRAASSIIALVTFSFSSASAHRTPGNKVDETPRAEQTPRNRRRSSMGMQASCACGRREIIDETRRNAVRYKKFEAKIKEMTPCHISSDGESQIQSAILGARSCLKN